MFEIQEINNAYREIYIYCYCIKWLFMKKNEIWVILADVPNLLYVLFICAAYDHARIITHMKSRHAGIFQSRSLTWAPVYSQAKKIIHNVDRYFIAEKVNKETIIHRKFEEHIRFGNAAYCIKLCLAIHQLERVSLYSSFYNRQAIVYGALMMLT